MYFAIKVLLTIFYKIFRICLELRTTTVDVAMFSALLRYLYTGDLCPHDPSMDLTLLRRLGEEFGTPNPLENDLRYLLESGLLHIISLAWMNG